MKHLLLAFQFLTIIPVRVNGDVSEKDIAQSACFFPVVGVFQGFLSSLSALLLLRLFSPEITAGLIVTLLIITNGGFHLDGLADTFDALAVKSKGDQEADREKMLAVMKDSTTGAIGVIAIVVSVLLKYLLVKNLFLDSSPAAACAFLLLMSVMSKWIMVPAMYHGRSARQNGLGRIFIENTGSDSLIFSSILTVFICAAVAHLAMPAFYCGAIAWFFISAAFLLYSFSFLSARASERKFGGLTGDNLGAISEVSEIIFLLVVIVWLRLSI